MKLGTICTKPINQFNFLFTPFVLLPQVPQFDHYQSPNKSYFVQCFVPPVEMTGEAYTKNKEPTG